MHIGDILEKYHAHKQAEAQTYAHSNPNSAYFDFFDIMELSSNLSLINQPIFFLSYSFFISVPISILLIINLLFFYNNPLSNVELESTYECGSVPLSHDLEMSNVNFQNVAVSFIIFDSEIVFLLPRSVVSVISGYTGFYSMLIFFIILSVGSWFEYDSRMSII